VALLHIAVLALIQGVTEFIPISSSGHLVLVPEFTPWPDQGMVMDVATHVGTLGAVMLYFWRDIGAMIRGLWRLMKGRRDPGARLAWYLIVGTLPAVAAGFAINHYIGEGLRSLTVVAWTLPAYAIVLFFADKLAMTLRRVEHLRFGDVILIGCAQALALVPGTSRSGITISAARFLGMERSEAARFSMLLSIPAIMGAGSLKGWELYQAGNMPLTTDIALAVGLSFVVGLIAIAFLMAWLRRSTFTPFVIYRLLLGAGLLVLVYS
jgi:undecaprenyl-diphosphatase